MNGDAYSLLFESVDNMVCTLDLEMTKSGEIWLSMM